MYKKGESVMEEYKLQDDEVILYRGTVTMDRKSVQLYLTNHNIVIENRIKKHMRKEKFTADVYPVADIKVYEGRPQINQDGRKMEIYLTGTVLIMDFPSTKEAKEFTNEAMQLITGEDAPKRGMEKVKGAFSRMMNSAARSNAAESAKESVEDGIEDLEDFEEKEAPKLKSALGSVRMMADSFGKSVSDAVQKKEDSLSEDKKAQNMTKLKDLYDAGVLTQEEYEAKKKALLESE